MLKQMPKTGDWIDPRQITSVQARPADDRSVFQLQDRVTVLHHKADDRVPIHETILCDSFEEAVQIRDQIAAMANEAWENS